MAHAKVMRVDDTAMLGGCNLDALSLFHNFELNLLFEDGGVAQRVQEHVFEAFEAVSAPVEIPTKPLQRAWDRAMDVLSPLL
jgi:phosphatidylserine/phosphatidylglycerophosphate/cardiolipin synthase-like enzyme